MKLFSKKGQGLSMNVIIIAAIALIVLVVLAVLLFGAGSDVSRARDCTSGIYDGECRVACHDGEQRMPSSSCPNNQYCCVVLFK